MSAHYPSLTSHVAAYRLGSLVTTRGASPPTAHTGRCYQIHHRGASYQPNFSLIQLIVRLNLVV